MPKNMKYDDVSSKAGATKTNQDGGGILAKEPSDAAKQLERNQEKEGSARKGAARGMDHKKGGAKAKPDANGDGIPDYAQDGIGASRMGYSQSFGASRMNSYARGAAKVADIMTNGGASRYAKFGAADAGHGGGAGHKHDPVDGSSATFTADNETGATVTTSRTTKPDAAVKKKEVSYSSAYKNADKNKYPTLSSFTTAAKDYNSKNPKPKAPGPTTTTNTLDTNPESVNKIKRGGVAEKQDFIAQINMKRYGDEMLAVKDSTETNNRNFKQLVSANSNNLTKTTLGYIQRHAGIAGNTAANATRTAAGLPTVKKISGTHDQYNGSIKRGESDVPMNQYWKKENNKIDKSKTVLLPNKPSTYKRSSPLYIPTQNFKPNN